MAIVTANQQANDEKFNTLFKTMQTLQRHLQTTLQDCEKALNKAKQIQEFETYDRILQGVLN